MKKILVVDDDVDIGEALQFTFNSAGYKTKTLTKGEEIYKMVDIFKPDAIVLDVLLSGKDGRTICKNLKATEKTKHIPILMMSSNEDIGKSTIKVGANNFLAKPFDIYTLIETVEGFF